MRIRRPIAAFLLATTPACTATYGVTPAQYVPQNHPEAIEVLDGEGFAHILENPTINGDMLVGVEAGTPDTLTLPVSQVTQARVKGKSPKRTMMLVGAIAGVATLSTWGFTRMGNAPSCKGFGDGGTAEQAGGKDQCDKTGAGGEAQP